MSLIPMFYIEMHLASIVKRNENKKNVLPQNGTQVPWPDTHACALGTRDHLAVT